VQLYNRETGEHRRLGFDTGPARFVYAGQVAGDWATWARVTPYSQEVYLTNLASTSTIKLRRPSGVNAQYNPAVTPDGTVYFARDRPCRRRCPRFNTPRARYQLVERRADGASRVVADLPRGADTSYLYADREGSKTRVLYARFWWLPRDYVSYGDLFSFTVRG
jgi:hypothetical protein